MGAWGEFTVSITVGELTCDRIISFSFLTLIFFLQLSRTSKFHFISTHCVAPELIFGAQNSRDYRSLTRGVWLLATLLLRLNSRAICGHTAIGNIFSLLLKLRAPRNSLAVATRGGFKKRISVKFSIYSQVGSCL